MLRGKALLLSAAAIALAGAGAGVLLATHGGSARAVRTTGDMPATASQASGKKTYAQLVAANYKILKPQQSARLLRYADAAFACMSQDVELGKPWTSPTKIVMTLPSGAFYKLELEDGTAADPPTFRSSDGISWNASDMIPLGSGRALRVLSKRLDENLDGDPVPVLVVEDLPGTATSAAG